MKRLTLLILAACTLLAVEPTYRIGFHFFPDPGRSMHYRSHETVQDTATFHTPDGKEMTKPIIDETNDEEYVEKVIAVEGNEPVDYTRTYSKPADKSYSGRPVHFTKTGGKVQATSNGATLDDLQALEKSEGNSDLPANRAMLPKGAVAVGQTWAVDPKPLIRTIGFGDIDAAHSTAVAKLVSVEQKNGHSIATVDVSLELAITSDNEGKLAASAPFHAKMRYEGAIDGSTWLHMTVDGGFKAQQQVTTKDGTKLTVAHDFRFTAEQQQEDVH